jgi:site-specific recombinase XerD
MGRPSHWLRHPRASYPLANGVELAAMRDNLRHASISTASIYPQATTLARLACWCGLNRNQARQFEALPTLFD